MSLNDTNIITCNFPLRHSLPNAHDQHVLPAQLFDTIYLLGNPIGNLLSPKPSDGSLLFVRSHLALSSSSHRKEKMTVRTVAAAGVRGTQLCNDFKIESNDRIRS